MSKTVLDSSAVLAYLRDEPGLRTLKSRYCTVEPLVPSTGQKLLPVSLWRVRIHMRLMHFLRKELCWLEEFSLDSLETAILRPRTRHLGLSLGDRACLALARRLGVPVLTADRIWLQLDLGLEIACIR